MDAAEATAVLARARHGDSDAFRALVQRHSGSLFRLAFGMTGNEQDAEDVVQESFLRAYRQLGRFQARANFGMLRASAELQAAYQADSSIDVHKAIANALFAQRDAATLVTLARAEKNPEMKRDLVSKLSLMKTKEATDYLLELLK